MKIIAMLPTYKEGDNLKILIPELLKIPNMHVLVIDDSSPDKTREIVSKLSDLYPNKIYFYQRHERGRATAGIFGFKKAWELKADIIVEMDADLSHRPEDLKKMLKNIDAYDVVIGSRFISGGKDSREGVGRQILSRISRTVYKIITGLKIKDIGSGFKCYKSYVIKKLLQTDFFSVAGTSICLEINFKMALFGYKIKEVPIDFVDRIYGSSKVTWRSFVEPIFIALKLMLTYGRI